MATEKKCQICGSLFMPNKYRHQEICSNIECQYSKQLATCRPGGNVTPTISSIKRPRISPGKRPADKGLSNGVKSTRNTLNFTVTRIATGTANICATICVSTGKRERNWKRATPYIKVYIKYNI
jgi:hypothetical protein